MVFRHESDSIWEWLPGLTWRRQLIAPEGADAQRHAVVMLYEIAEQTGNTKAVS